MTTTVVVDAHAGWPVRVVQVDTKLTDITTEIRKFETVVPPHEKASFAVWYGRHLEIHEMRRPEPEMKANIDK